MIMTGREREKEREGKRELHSITIKDFNNRMCIPATGFSRVYRERSVRFIKGKNLQTYFHLENHDFSELL